MKRPGGRIPLPPWLLKVFDVHGISPMLAEIFSHKATVALVRFFLAAKKACAIHDGWINALFDFPISEQVVKLAFIENPISPMLFVGVKNVLRGSQKWQVDIIHPQDLFQEVFQIPLFGKTGELRCVIEPNIHYSLCAGSAKRFKKCFGAFLGEPDGVYFYGSRCFHVFSLIAGATHAISEARRL